MRGLIGLLAVVVVGSGCANAADNCHNTKTCEPPPDAGVIYVVSDAGMQCDGFCAPLPSAGADWSTQPFIRWTGLTTHVPKQLCPSITPVSSEFWYSNPDQLLTCPTCSCAPSTGVCALPKTVTVSASPMCPSDAGDAGVPFDPPNDWDGGCTANDAIAAVECDGGACSATAGLMIPFDQCVPKQAIIPKNVTWGSVAYTCTGVPNGSCKNPGEVCTPAPPELPVDFTVCVSRQGDDPNVKCPQGYPARSVFYLAADDNRACAPCGCEPPQGSACSSLVSLYADDACSMQIGSVMATSSTAMCVEIAAGSPLGSKQATSPTYTPGSCQPSGGEEVGGVQPIDPFTFCCEQ